MTLSNNFVFGDDFAVTLNGVPVVVQVNKLAFSFTAHYVTGVNRRLQ